VVVVVISRELDVWCLWVKMESGGA